mmetsp:Transcript_5814/g.22072  ORF Transcript_5814/g.22072 Transcript_5814/m.22072 type:complete len:123 (-) Transcript_5814:1887-2255(-)
MKKPPMRHRDQRWQQVPFAEREIEIEGAFAAAAAAGTSSSKERGVLTNSSAAHFFHSSKHTLPNSLHTHMANAQIDPLNIFLLVLSVIAFVVACCVSSFVVAHFVYKRVTVRLFGFNEDSVI